MFSSGSRSFGQVLSYTSVSYNIVFVLFVWCFVSLYLCCLCVLCLCVGLIIGTCAVKPAG